MNYRYPVLCFFLGFLIMAPAISQEEVVEGDEVAQDSLWKFKQMPYTHQNIQVPRELWVKIKDLLKEDGVSEKIVEDFAIMPISMQVELYSEDHFVLKDERNHRLLFTEGGGDLDLFDYVTGKGEFFIRFSPELIDENGFHMLYVSDSPGKKVGGDPWGNGCGKIFDITEKAGQFLLDQGMHVTSARRHYLHLMAGTFIIFQLVEDRLYLGYIRLTDSRYPQFKCRDA